MAGNRHGQSNDEEVPHQSTGSTFQHCELRHHSIGTSNHSLITFPLSVRKVFLSLVLNKGPVAMSAKKKGPKIPRHGIPARTAKDFNSFPISKVKGKLISSRNFEFLLINKMHDRKQTKRERELKESERDSSEEGVCDK
jgi:hypothetical protein